MDWKAITERFDPPSNVYLLKMVDGAGDAYYKIGIADNIDQ